MFQKSMSISSFFQLYPATLVLVCFQSVLWSSSFFIGKEVFSIVLGKNAEIAAGELWRLFTPIFVHFHFIHIFSNTLLLIVIGPFVEARAGSLRFFLFYLLTGAAGNTAAYFIMPPFFTHIGASGSLFGLLGFCFYILYTDWRHYRKEQLLLAGIALFSILFFTFSNPNSNTIAHIFGFLSGSISAPFFLNKKKSKHYFT